MSHHYIHFSDVTYRYPDGTTALDNVNFLISHGEKVALLGLNGAGKSTLILHTNGILMADSGEVNVGDVPVCKKTLPLVRQSVGLVFQNSDDQLFMPTVEEDVAFGPLNMGLPQEEVNRRVDKALEDVGALELKHRSASALSGGQKKAVAIATVLSMGPSIMVLDEPTSDLDCTARRRLIDLLKGFHHTLLVATHDLDLARELCPRALLLYHGRIVADGPTAGILSDTALLASAGMRM
ncbi:MAG: energy-coupling factor ABC transporter ATP-binding protein [Muribaculaceae bacterium]|nr:energy-coupling factor ABC transporter ATP-binding protein [Muribaculaceae bacterium]